MITNNERKMTCIICPRGCQLTVTLKDGGEPLNVEGQGCRRGREYAISECTDPRRTVTSTVRCKNGGMVAVKTSSPIPKGMIFDVMKVINETKAESSVKLGDILVSDILGTGADVVATSEIFD